MVVAEPLWRSIRSENFFTCSFTFKDSGSTALPRA